MNQLILPFSTSFQPQLGMSNEEILVELDRLMRRQKAIDAVLHGEMEDDVLYDILAEDNINPHEWAEMAIENCEFIVSQ